MPLAAAAHQRRRVKSFGLAARKVVLDGGVGRILEMARTSLRNIRRPSTLVR
jgi:hypothetical protein